MSDSPVKLLEKLLHGHRRTPEEEVVILSQVLACEATLGYEDLFNVQASKAGWPTHFAEEDCAQMMIQSNTKE